MCCWSKTAVYNMAPRLTHSAAEAKRRTSRRNVIPNVEATSVGYSSRMCSSSRLRADLGTCDATENHILDGWDLRWTRAQLVTAKAGLPPAPRCRVVLSTLAGPRTLEGQISEAISRMPSTPAARKQLACHGTHRERLVFALIRPASRKRLSRPCSGNNERHADGEKSSC